MSPIRMIRILSLCSLVGALLPMASASPAHAQTVPTDSEEGFATVISSDATEGHDYEWTLDPLGRPTLVATYPLGTLAGGGGGGGAGGPETSGMERTETDCFRISSSYTYGYYCLHFYKPRNGDGDPDFNYRVAFWTGSGKARCCNDLKRIRLGMWKPAGDSRSGQQITMWRPNGTSNPPNSCTSKTVTLTLNYGLTSGSVGETFQTCSETYGPYAFSERDFGFQWTGERDHNWVLGMGGGAEFKFRPSNGWSLAYNGWHRYCTPDWAC